MTTIEGDLRIGETLPLYCPFSTLPDGAVPFSETEADALD